MGKQISIFDLLEEQKKSIEMNTFDNMISQLECYEIDEYYRKHFKGNCSLLREIEDNLIRLPKYYEYREKMFNLLTKYFQDREDIELIYIKEYDYIRVYEPKKTYPLYCLEMFNKENFK